MFSAPPTVNSTCERPRALRDQPGLPQRLQDGAPGLLGEQPAGAELGVQGRPELPTPGTLWRPEKHCRIHWLL